ncbi:acetylornithine deacetylase [Kordiimonas aestuarii]|uniref:acetylornithine deacetylase n=1 Tax=Kordiimonas aestuarii TaxID=1005925 RepID=UPI0021D30143|nr:acetylornithine deacetylase [Kordiimonas aestuarii]
MSDVAQANAAIVPMLAKLVGFDTTSRNSNLALIDYIQTYLHSHGIKSTLVRNAGGDKANLLATIGPNVAGGVVLSGHTDVVPIDGQDWATDAFTLHEGGAGKLHARGTADMKGFIAVCLAYVPVFKAANLKRPIHLAFTYDEEVGCLGIQAMLPHLREHCATPRLVVVGEPTSMQVAAAHKGQYVSRTRIYGLEAHSSRPEDGVNAVAAAAELISMITGYAMHERRSGVHDDMFDPPYTSFNVGPIKGGSAFNIIPGECEFDWEFRFVPGTDGQAIIDGYQRYLDEKLNPRLRAAGGDGCYAENEVWAYLPPLTATPGSDAETLAKMLANRNDTMVVAFGTEAGHFQSIDFPTVVCGPGDIAQAHKPDEFIEVSELQGCGALMKRLADVLSS